MKGIYISLALIALACQPGRSQKQLHDTLSTETSYQIDEVVVTGARQKTDVRHLSQTVSIVGRAQIENSRQSRFSLFSPNRSPVSSLHRGASWVTVCPTGQQAVSRSAD